MRSWEEEQRHSTGPQTRRRALHELAAVQQAQRLEPIPTLNSCPSGIAAGPDGNLWFTESQGNQIGRITPQGDITEYPLPSANSGPGGIVGGPDGNLWFTEGGSNKIGRITSR